MWHSQNNTELFAVFAQQLAFNLYFALRENWHKIRTRKKRWKDDIIWTLRYDEFNYKSLFTPIKHFHFNWNFKNETPFFSRNSNNNNSNINEQILFLFIITQYLCALGINWVICYKLEQEWIKYTHFTAHVKEWKMKIKAVQSHREYFV